MAKIIACYKWVLDESDIRVDSALNVDFSQARYKISDYDKNTIEAASRLAKTIDAETVGISCGGPETKKSFADALARGLGAGIWVKTEESLVDSVCTARLLASAVSTVEEPLAVLCSEGSSDEYARQTAARIAAKLDWPFVSSVVSVEYADGEFLATKKMEDSFVKVSVKAPCVFSVLPEIAPATIPGLKQVMEAKRKKVEEITPADLGVDMISPVERIEIKGYSSQRKNVIFHEVGNVENVKALVQAMRKDGIV